MKKRIYLDNAATTPLDPRVKRVMEPYWEKIFGNPSGIYEEGRRAKEALEKARKEVASFINSSSDEIIFTSGGTESNNLAIFGVTGTKFPGALKSHIITSKIEHKSVLISCKELEKNGFEVTYLNPDEDGLIDPKDLKDALRPETVLVSIIYANNEIGVVQPIPEMAKVIKDFRKKSKSEKGWPYFHIDACQASGYLDMDINKLGVDLLSANGSKVYGPKGIGFLYKRKGLKLKPFIYGGGQEKGFRSGTENIPAIVGLAEALKIVKEEGSKEVKRISKLRDELLAGILKKIPRVFLNGHKTKRLANNLNISVLGVEGESIVLYLDALGIAVSTGSACNSSDLEPSHVVNSLGKPIEFAHGSLRFSLGRYTTKEDVNYVIKVFPDIIKKLRSISAIE
ncbi:MAG: cysteine desulfurase [Parcubacteria group bacterium]|nr:cysteine desulfurase [Parcubacteria group bacterium]MCR4342640.1 cysteine desulfurase [Patescibacteria group bacterium]